MTARPRVLHVITSLAVGGAQRHLLRLIAGLNDEYDCDLVYFKDDDLLPEFTAVAGDVTPLELGRWVLGTDQTFFSRVFDPGVV